MNEILNFIIQIGVLLFAVSVHESAHGWMAEKFGDPTARNQGRITLNPIPHIDPVGSIIFPIILALMHAPVFGWAKPVIVNPYNLRNPRRDHMFIAAAGPVSNIFIVIVGIVVFLILKKFGIVNPVPLFFVSGSNPGILTIILFSLIFINTILAIFNLIPIPPLDGSGIIEGILKGEALYNYQKIKPYGFIILIVIIWTPLFRMMATPIFQIIRSILLKG